MGFFSRFFSKPVSTTLTVTSGNGFHLRPVAQFVNLAKNFSCEITAICNHKTVNAKTVNTLLSLGLEKEDSFELQAQGKDAKEAVEKLEALFTELMQDDKEVEVLQKEDAVYEGKSIEGEIISRGVAIAAAYRYRERENRTENGVNFSEALADSFEELDTLYRTHAQNEDAGIYLAQKELLQAIADQVDSLEALEETIGEESARLVGSKMEVKITDYKDILQRVKKQMGFSVEMLLPETPFILLAKDLLPSQIELLQKTQVEGVVLKETTLTSHTAILLRGAGIPSLIADYSDVKEKEKIILDAHCGLIVTMPSEQDLQKAQKRQADDLEQQHIAADRRFEKALTRGKKQIRVFANVTDVHSAQTAKEQGAEGIGLLRTEFLFKEEKPSLEAQTEAYEAIFSLFDDVTVRTLDVGGDKKLPYLTLPKEENPFLGIRGVRLFKTHPQLMEEQLHAIFAAAKGRPLKVMFPMVSTVDEFTEAKIFAERTAEKHKLDIASIRFGIMVEVPSVLFLIPDFNRVVDFYSIGTNDLTQYLFAIERTHPSLKVDEHSPVVFDAIRTVIVQADKPVSICGELAGDPEAIGTLLKIGMETLSVSPKSIATTKEEIRHV
ncbi:HPr family phosphocarrier protein [Sulfurovum riftiae]|uniref:PTS fructose transporter subunit IIBC n=1 Tax=Sulfurovum riftiae TaxID=1630136 RepID=A0A151CEX6_9BACT|nr:HPr family phosphocarrier protein [Sulfurovum riftiae]KYJ86071.1 PTS fructose transporter subunit IIBC [Sulfurovum riftiae]